MLENIWTQVQKKERPLKQLQRLQDLDWARTLGNSGQQQNITNQMCVESC